MLLENGHRWGERTYLAQFVEQKQSIMAAIVGRKVKLVSNDTNGESAIFDVDVAVASLSALVSGMICKLPNLKFL